MYYQIKENKHFVKNSIFSPKKFHTVFLPQIKVSKSRTEDLWTVVRWTKQPHSKWILSGNLEQAFWVKVPVFTTKPECELHTAHLWINGTDKCINRLKEKKFLQNSYFSQQKVSILTKIPNFKITNGRNVNSA